MLKSRTGIEDDTLLDELMNTPLHWPFYNDPLNTANVVFNRGEELLQDSAWMEPKHLEAIARYQGETIPQQTVAEIAADHGDAPLFINEHEAILDREDVSPALTPFRDDAYYEHKRRLHELGEQKVGDMERFRAHNDQ